MFENMVAMYVTSCLSVFFSTVFFFNRAEFVCHLQPVVFNKWHIPVPCQPCRLCEMYFCALSTCLIPEVNSYILVIFQLADFLK